MKITLDIPDEIVNDWINSSEIVEDPTLRDGLGYTIRYGSLQSKVYKWGILQKVSKSIIKKCDKKKLGLTNSKPAKNLRINK